MKKYLLIAFLSSCLVILGCTKTNLANLDVSAIADLPTLEDTIRQVSDAMDKGTIGMDQAQMLVEQLQQKYIDLTDATIQTIESGFDTIQEIFIQKGISIYTLPLWAKKLGMTQAQGMSLDTQLSKPIIITSESESIILVYTGLYNLAMQQASSIASKANLNISKNFAQAQSLAKIGDVEYISGLDIGGLIKGIVYTNHELLDKNIEYLLSVSVDQDGTLTIEATKYKN